MEVFIKDLNKVVDSLQIAEVVVVDIYTDAEVQTSISAVHNFEVAELRGEMN